MRTHGSNLSCLKNIILVFTFISFLEIVQFMQLIVLLGGEEWRWKQKWLCFITVLDGQQTNNNNKCSTACRPSRTPLVSRVLRLVTCEKVPSVAMRTLLLRDVPRGILFLASVGALIIIPCIFKFQTSNLCLTIWWLWCWRHHCAILCWSTSINGVIFFIEFSLTLLLTINILSI